MSDSTIISRSGMPELPNARGVYETASDALRFDRKAAKLDETLRAFVTQMYKFDELKQPLYVDPVDYRVLAYVPWCKRWVLDDEPALLKTERDVLRAIISDSQKSETTPPLFIYDQPNYYLCPESYKNLKAAIRWVDSLKINGATYRKYDSKRRQVRRNRDAAKRAVKAA